MAFDDTLCGQLFHSLPELPFQVLITLLSCEFMCLVKQGFIHGISNFAMKGGLSRDTWRVSV